MKMVNTVIVRYGYPDATIFKSDNRSSYNALMLRVQGNVAKRFNLTAHYTFSKCARPGDAYSGELFDYVNGVCNDPSGQPNGFGPGDYGPSGEDVRHRFVLAGTVHVPGGFEVSTITQAESARPFTITNANGERTSISVMGTPTALDAFRGTPYIQVDMRVARPVKVNDRLQVYPFAEFFNLFNRNNPGANFIGTISLLPVVTTDGINVTGICGDPSCSPATDSHYQPEAARNPIGRPGRFLRPRHNRRNTFRRTIGCARNVLVETGLS